MSGKLTTLYSFPAGFPPCPSDFTPECGPLIQASDGNIYGAGTYGGANGGEGGLTGGGSFFKITPGGTFSTVYNFCSQPNCADGSNPIGLVQGSDGNFYGATYLGGTQSPSCFGSSCGTIFRITSSGALKTLHSFSGADGTLPTGVVQATNGAFYGFTTGGGASGDGTVFALSVGLGPFVGLLPGSGKAGTTVQILGSSLTGATAVSFNGLAAAFTVESKTLISATVPTGATTGFVTVTTPSGTLQSNVKFHVR